MNFMRDEMKAGRREPIRDRRQHEGDPVAKDRCPAASRSSSYMLGKRGTRLVEAARVMNAKNDAVDRSCGCATPSGLPVEAHARVVLTMLASAINGQDWTQVASAYAEFEGLHARMVRSNAKKPAA